MTAPKRKREVQLNFRVSPEELALIEQKMAQLGTKNREAYLRKMALDGYVVRLELPELRACSYSMIRHKRVAHVMGVEEEAVKLAKFWGADPELARHAGILHDCTKYLELTSQLHLCAKYGIGRPAPPVPAVRGGAG